ncbi:hypothetical protein U1Q18_049616 [Sarracenia purpurea var. burkii]
MNVIAIIVLIAVSLESISASRRIVHKSPSCRNPSIEKSPSLNATRQKNMSNGSSTLNVLATTGNTPKPVARLPSSNRQQSKNGLKNVPAPMLSQNKPKNVPAPMLSQSPKPNPSSSRAKANTATDPIAEPKTPLSPVAPISYKMLEKGKVTIVKGEKGKIFVDDTFLFDYDDDLKKGKLRFNVTATNDVLVNDRVVLKKRPQDPLIIRQDPDIMEDGITKFQVKIDKFGNMQFTSNLGLSKTYAIAK